MYEKYYYRYIHVGPGGVAQWPSHPPQEPKTRLRIPPGYNVLGDT
jgi:hypothetical protein